MTDHEQSPKQYRRVINSWVMYDWANSAFATTVMAAILPVYYSKVAGATLSGNKPTFYWGYTVSIALIITALLSPVMGAIADCTGTKKRFLMMFAAIGIFFTALLYFVATGDWLMASVLFIISNVGFAVSDVFYNSLLPHVAEPEDIDQVSTKGYALGYFGGGILLAINVVMIRFMKDVQLAARLSFVSVSIWWAVFSIPLIMNVKEPSPTTNVLETSNSISAGFKRLHKTFRDLRQYRQLLLFLFAFWIYNDGIGTIIKMATIYGAEIGIGINTLIGTLLMTQFVGIPFSFGFGRLAKRMGNKACIYIGLLVYTLISICGFFISTAWHFWVLGFMVGTVQGGTQALSRSLYGSMLPKAKTAEFFGFYGMSSKFAGIFGPLIFSIVAQISGTSRLGIIFLVLFFSVGTILLSRVDVKQGINRARQDDMYGSFASEKD
jgi:UMF1 family MFS transporter